jgi:hypothetical protein
MEATSLDLQVHLRSPHEKQAQFVNSEAKRIVLRAGRRGGKTFGISIRAVKRFLAGKRILYATPTSEQIDRFWFEIKRALAEPIDAGILYKNESRHLIAPASAKTLIYCAEQGYENDPLPGDEMRIRAKTAWNADTMRGDYADELYLDEFQIMSETAWTEVGAPMMLDTNGNAVFIYTPPSLHSASVSKARDPQFVAKLYKRAQMDKTGRWAAFHFTSMDNPYLNTEALAEIAKDMTELAYRQEVLAEDVDEAPGALWKRERIEANRIPFEQMPVLNRIVVGVDPSGSSSGAEAGVIVAGKSGQDYYTIEDDSLQGTPQAWARAAVGAYHRYNADCIAAEDNYGGEMVEAVIKQVDGSVRVKRVRATRGKQVRAEPIAAIAEQGRDHHVGYLGRLEDELCLWENLPGQLSPNRLDAKVWAITELGGGGTTAEDWSKAMRARVENNGLDRSDPFY